MHSDSSASLLWWMPGGALGHIREWYCFRSIFKTNELWNAVIQVPALSFVKSYAKMRFRSYSRTLCASLRLYVPSINHAANSGSKPLTHFGVCVWGGTYQPCKVIQLHRERQYTEVQTHSYRMTWGSVSVCYQVMAHHGQRVPEAVFLGNFFYFLPICLINHWSLSPESGHTFGKLAFEFGAVCWLDVGGGRWERGNLKGAWLRNERGKAWWSGNRHTCGYILTSCDDFKQVSQSLGALIEQPHSCPPFLSSLISHCVRLSSFCVMSSICQSPWGNNSTEAHFRPLMWSQWMGIWDKVCTDGSEQRVWAVLAHTARPVKVWL